jgi:hypothetical protein
LLAHLHPTIPFPLFASIPKTFPSPFPHRNLPPNPPNPKNIRTTAAPKNRLPFKNLQFSAENPIAIQSQDSYTQMLPMTDGPQPELAQMPESPHLSTRLLLLCFGIGFFTLLSAALLPNGTRIPRAALGILGIALISPILCLFFKVYHAMVPHVFRSRMSIESALCAEEA